MHATSSGSLPPERIRFIHLAGGTHVHASTGEEQWLDDHCHEVPDPVYDMLEIVGECVLHGVDVVIERDVRFLRSNTCWRSWIERGPRSQPEESVGTQ